MFARVMLLACLLALCCGCKPRPQTTRAPAPPGLSPAHADTAAPTEQVASATSRFAFNLFDRLRAQNPKANLFVSPLSVTMALAMTANGAAGDTRTAMLQTLDMAGLSPEQINQGLQALRAGLGKDDPEVKLTIADSLWTTEGIELKAQFVDLSRQFFDAEARSLDFNDPKSAHIINGWVKDKTNGLIPEITNADSLRRLSVILLDAVYFKGRWSDAFDRAATQDAPFTLLGGSHKTVPMMSQMDRFAYLQTDDFQAIRLPYGKQRTAMYVFLPATGSSLESFCGSLTPQKWEQWLGQMSSQRGTIKLPRFTAKYDQKLNDVLVALGMGVAFDRDKADFSAMSESEMWIDLVRHKSYLKVDEEGTEAAAVTAVGMAGKAAPPRDEPFKMTVDRPFFLAIQDGQTKTILFLGAIVAPEEA